MKVTSDTRIEDPATVQRIFSTCGEAHGWSCHLLYRNRLYRCSRVHTLDRYLSRLGVEHENFTDQDGLIHRWQDQSVHRAEELFKVLRTSEGLQFLPWHIRRRWSNTLN